MRRAVAVKIESPPPELYAVEEAYQRIVEAVAVYVAERGRLDKEKYDELYRHFRELYPQMPAQPARQAVGQGAEVGRLFLELSRNGRVCKGRSPQEEMIGVKENIPRPVVHAVQTLLASSQGPAMLARASSTTPIRGADEGRAGEPPRGALPHAAT
ncbi:MAG: hypothetical protein LM577_04335 [Thermoproteaceae archaeon]|jgi:hypothetical protein|nr:hypothetical protein [Thermoproteaceae archaeon]